MSYVERILSGAAPPLIEDSMGDGVSAARSAQVIRDELATLAADDPRREELEAQAAAWDQRSQGGA